MMWNTPLALAAALAFAAASVLSGVAPAGAVLARHHRAQSPWASATE